MGAVPAPTAGVGAMPGGGGGLCEGAFPKAGDPVDGTISETGTVPGAAPRFPGDPSDQRPAGPPTSGHPTAP